MTSLSATIGTGNIAGVATAIALGGPGALFWMWVTALVGMATKYAEAVCAVTFRERDDKGNYNYDDCVGVSLEFEAENTATHCTSSKALITRGVN